MSRFFCEEEFSFFGVKIKKCPNILTQFLPKKFNVRKVYLIVYILTVTWYDHFFGRIMKKFYRFWKKVLIFLKRSFSFKKASNYHKILFRKTCSFSKNFKFILPKIVFSLPVSEVKSCAHYQPTLRLCCSALNLKLERK